MAEIGKSHRSTDKVIIYSLAREYMIMVILIQDVIMALYQFNGTLTGNYPWAGLIKKYFLSYLYFKYILDSQ